MIIDGIYPAIEEWLGEKRGRRILADDNKVVLTENDEPQYGLTGPPQDVIMRYLDASLRQIILDRYPINSPGCQGLLS